MSEQYQPDNISEPRDEQKSLAHWLEQVMAIPTQSSLNEGTDLQLKLLAQSDYHIRFYQQIPDFALALLQHNTQAVTHHAPLLYHLVGCSVCHGAYLEIYDALRFALSSDDRQMGNTQSLSIRPVGTVPPRLAVHLSKLWISQAESILRQAHREQADEDALARSLLQQAISITARISQSNVRTEALADLVHVATLFDEHTQTDFTEPATHSYTLLPAGAGGTRRAKTLRKVDTPVRSADEITREQPAIQLQSKTLEGSITQQGDTLLLQLHDLDQSLYGHYLTITVPLGSLIEPVHWLGGNPHTIRSVTPVDNQGNLTTPLGQTDLRLTQPEERNILEVTFMRLDVRVAI